MSIPALNSGGVLPTGLFCLPRPAAPVELKTSRQARNAPSAYGIFNVIYHGRVVAEHPISGTRFRNIMWNLAEQRRFRSRLQA
jgi:YoaP-like